MGEDEREWWGKGAVVRGMEKASLWVERMIVLVNDT